jgi:TM2 domain-containing membrane protein YozV
MAHASSLAATAPNGKSKIAAALLAFFLGGLGVHKFYLGQIGLGFIYLLFFWTFIPAIIAFVEFIIYLTMSDEAFNNKYGYD